jgi:hypothetical protein
MSQNEEVITWSIDRRPDLVIHDRRFVEFVEPTNTDPINIREFSIGESIHVRDYPLPDLVADDDDEPIPDLVANDDDELITPAEFTGPTNFSGVFIYSFPIDYIDYAVFYPAVKVDIDFIISKFELSDEEDKNCCICMEETQIEDICKLQCSHTFCVKCINAELNIKRRCPICRAYIFKIQTQTIKARQQIHH